MAVVADIRVAVMFGLSIWFFFYVISCFLCLLVVFGCCFLFFVFFCCLWFAWFLVWGSSGIQILDSEVRKVWGLSGFGWGSIFLLSPLRGVLRVRRNRSVASFGGSGESVLNIREGELAVLTYTSAADKMKVFSSFIREGLEGGDMVFYAYPDEESVVVRKKLVQNGIDPDRAEKSEKRGSLILRSLSEHYLRDGRFDYRSVIKKELELRSEAKRAGYKHFRDLDDVGNLSFLKGDWQVYMRYWDDPCWGIPSGTGPGIVCEPFIMDLTAINVDGLSEESIRSILTCFSAGNTPASRLIDFLEYTEAFSKAIGLPHEELLGRKMLLEFDPASDYERVVENAAKEALSHLEPVYVFTRHASGIYEFLARQRSVRIVLMSASASTSTPVSENQIVLPADNTPLVLDSLRDILNRHGDQNVFLIFDNVSELIMCVGFDKAYKFLLCAMEMTSSKPATVLFLINRSAHEAQELSRVRGLFQNILAFERNALEVIKKMTSS